MFFFDRRIQEFQISRGPWEMRGWNAIKQICVVGFSRPAAETHSMQAMAAVQEQGGRCRGDGRKAQTRIWCIFAVIPGNKPTASASLRHFVRHFIPLLNLIVFLPRK
jgi:hypothetical protein